MEQLDLDIMYIGNKLRKQQHKNKNKKVKNKKTKNKSLQHVGAAKAMWTKTA